MSVFSQRGEGANTFSVCKEQVLKFSLNESDYEKSFCMFDRPNT